jgi:hypothetical protein
MPDLFDEIERQIVAHHARTRVEGDRVVTSIRSGAHYSAKLVASGRLLLNGLAEKWRAAASAIRFTRG